MMHRLGWLSAILYLSACFGSALPSGALRCDDSLAHPCPSGMVCLAGRCEDASALFDLGADGTTDARMDSGDLGQPDTFSPLSCTDPEQVGTSDGNLLEPALRHDGLMVVARRSAGEYLASFRPNRSSSFGPWTIDNLFTDGEDPSFFHWDNREQVIRAYGSPRHLQRCQPHGSCMAISLSEAATEDPILDDVDGPSVAGALSTPQLVLNRGTELWHGTPLTPGDLTSWRVDKLPFPGNDPAISPDGLILVFERPDAGGADLWIARRSRPDAAFDTPELFEAVNSTLADNEPDLVAGPSGGVELFFRSNREGDGISRVYRSLCQ